ncbi:MAG: HD family hydrolase [Candidatus Aramenus sulfurataquae]|jgi:putative hydrolase of HD superfamily|uniref:5'-deoxynucleotidase n=2 Tax=Candidatus Aramenus sulfurataquae TaxID=1326980 RepID=A0A0F2LQ73_9CREN|nr:HD family hydrolase [Candidatus Aramenus sp.]MCL7343585.1 HD family hydrolase [Candidatus Aramenus sulfurataquae]
MQLERLLTACKNLARTGWMQRGVPPSMAETVSSHSFEASVLAYAISLKLREKGVEVNPDHAAVIALFHDVGESVLGDLPKWASRRVDKSQAELEAYRELGIGEELFKEYKERNTLEAKVARLSDRLSTVVQANRYAKLGFDVREIAESYLKEINEMLSSHPFDLVKDFVQSLIGVQ